MKLIQTQTSNSPCIAHHSSLNNLETTNKESVKTTSNSLKMKIIQVSDLMAEDSYTQEDIKKNIQDGRKTNLVSLIIFNILLKSIIMKVIILNKYLWNMSLFIA